MIDRPLLALLPDFPATVLGIPAGRAISTVSGIVTTIATPLPGAAR